MNSRLGTRKQAAIIFDSDGTVTIGHGPVRAYAQAIPKHPLANAAAFAEQVEAALTDIDGLKSPYRDGYHAVADLAIAQRIQTEELSRAYLASRQLLGTDHAPVEMPRTLPPLLAAIAPHAWEVLATNAPEVGIEKLLERWRLREYFDAMSINPKKPAALSPLIDALNSQTILPIGDIAENDLVPPRELAVLPLILTPLPTVDDTFDHISAWAH